MQARRPAVAGQFYADKHDACVAEIVQSLQARSQVKNLPETIVAGIVPHAGWMFSGDVAALVYNSIKQVNPQVDTFIILGAVHWPYGKSAAVYDSGSWMTPLGQVEIDTDVAEALIDANTKSEANTQAHQFEHSIEVQVPFVQYLFPGAKIVPVMVPPAEFAVDFGSNAADVIKHFEGGKKIICIGSTDLTHYGPRYGFDPVGVGKNAIKWAKEVNDHEFIDFALQVRAEQILHTALQHHNACGAGAAAATVAVAKALGKTKGVLLAHTHSNEVMEKQFGQTSDESVGYAGIVF